MSELKSMIGREITSVYLGNNNVDGVYYYPSKGYKIVLEHELHFGSMGNIDCFFAVTYNSDGIEINRSWLGQNSQINWKETKVA